jgi:hypothetical protein
MKFPGADNIYNAWAALEKNWNNERIVPNRTYLFTHILALNSVNSKIPTATATGVQDVTVSSMYGLGALPLKFEIMD